ncbi:MAG: hypothetical protein WC738_06630 [Candidatus Omnitrophota bacterium]|jgi:hypothetical protein
MQSRYKSKSGEKFVIIAELQQYGDLKAITLGAYNSNTRSEAFAVIYLYVSGLTLMQASIPWDDIRVDEYLLGRGLNLAYSKIDNKSKDGEKIEVLHDDINNIDEKISKLKSPVDEFRVRRKIQEDILGCIYKKPTGVFLNELIDYAWCNKDMFAEELSHLNEIGLVSSSQPSSDDLEEIFNSVKKPGEYTGLPATLTSNGKKRYEEIVEQNILNMNAYLEPFENWVPFGSNKKVFLAHRFKEEKLCEKIKNELTKIGFEVKEGKVDDLGYISDDILSKIEESGFFLALLTPSKEFKDEKWSTSSWVLMEVGAAIAYKRKVLILAEECIEQEEYASKLQRDCQYETFNRENFLDKLQKVISRLKKEWAKQEKA